MQDLTEKKRILQQKKSPSKTFLFIYAKSLAAKIDLCF